MYWLSARARAYRIPFHLAPYQVTLLYTILHSIILPVRGQPKQRAPSYQTVCPKQCILQEEEKHMLISRHCEICVKWMMEHFSEKWASLTWLAGRGGRGRSQPFSWIDVRVHILSLALAGVAQWIEHQPVNQRVQLDSPSGHMPGLQAWSQDGCSERQPRIDVFLPHFLPPSPAL